MGHRSRCCHRRRWSLQKPTCPEVVAAHPSKDAAQCRPATQQRPCAARWLAAERACACAPPGRQRKPPRARCLWNRRSSPQRCRHQHGQAPQLEPGAGVGALGQQPRAEKHPGLDGKQPICPAPSRRRCGYWSLQTGTLCWPPAPPLHRGPRQRSARGYGDRHMQLRCWQARFRHRAPPRQPSGHPRC